jgi:alanyl-tRNA synthetase
MATMTSSEIRSAFLDFFRSKGHVIVPSAPIVMKNDPTLLFTNAGMNQFKDYFLGNSISPHARVADTQKCLRVSGKHNDLEEVGVDTYHHTMFEMLGNWSFGDYFKPEAIAWSWELLTKIYAIPKDRIYVSIFEGDQAEGLPKDQESFEEWKKWIDPNRILLGNKKDNFWEMGDSGPCGPCTEIHVDCREAEQRARIDGLQLVNQGDPQVIEIWNNVFIQFNRLKDGRLEPLPARHVDTGMGLERLTRVLQGKQSNYDTDVFSPLIGEIKQLTGTLGDSRFSRSDSKPSIALRVVADHIRAICFTLADGQLPSNTGAGYVIRRILRRAVRYYYSYLDFKQPLLFRLVPFVARQFETVFPELAQQQEFVARVVREEEEAFLRTLDKGLKKMDDMIASAQSAGKKIISGAFAFELFDTYGFPLDLTKLIGSEQQLEVDEAGFDLEMKKQKDRSRAASAVQAGDWVTLIDNPLLEFVGYDTLEIPTRIARYRQVIVKGKQAFQLVLEASPFYAESGGQVGDRGTLRFAEDTVEVVDTKKENELIVLFTEKLPKNLGQELVACVDARRRKAITAHHSATHLLHAALRQVLGKHVAQKGSLVNADHLRFDFSHFEAVSPAQLQAVEQLVNEKIREDIPVVVREMPKDEALHSGAMALFGEKYGEMVRVVIMDPAYSVELCGGTHVGRTGELGFFILTMESSVAAGVRRMEAKAAKAAIDYLNEDLLGPLDKIKNLTKKRPTETPAAVENLILENLELKRKLEKLASSQLRDQAAALLERSEQVGSVRLVASQVEVDSSDMLKKLALDLKQKLPSGAILLYAEIAGRAHVCLAFSDGLADQRNWDANQIIKADLAPLIGGKGGGQKYQALASGPELAQWPKLEQHLRSWLSLNS